MSETSIVFGRILIRSEDSLKQAKNNLEIIKQLPSQDDDEFNYLTSEMFNSNLLPSKRNVILAFGRSYINIEHYWDDWINSFESFLHQIDWESVNVILETEMFGTHQYMWFKKYHWSGELLLTKDSIKNHELQEFEHWYFGKGYRNFWGHKNEWGHTKMT